MRTAIFIIRGYSGVCCHYAYIALNPDALREWLYLGKPQKQLRGLPTTQVAMELDESCIFKREYR